MLVNLFKSVLHNLGVVLVGLILASLGKVLDASLGVSWRASLPAKLLGWPLLALGFVLRVLAASYFYSQGMRVISLQPQQTLLTSGPYRFSRNPLYLGGNVFIFLGASLLLGSPTALLATLAHLPSMNRMVRREERQMEKNFGQAWRNYRARVPRWI